MYSKPHGHTHLDIIATIAIIFVAVLFVVFLTNPSMRLKKAYDAQREEGVRDLTEIVLELRQDDPDAFNRLLEDVSNGPRMLGEASDCKGTFSDMCSDEQVEDTCLQLSDYVSLNESLPVDPNNRFSEDQTGYTLSFNGTNLVIANCMPESRESIEIISRVQ